MSGHPDILDLWLDGRLAGSLMRGPTDEVEFSYDAEYFNSRGVTPLSVSMPLVQQHYGTRGSTILLIWNATNLTLMEPVSVVFLLQARAREHGGRRRSHQSSDHLQGEPHVPDTMHETIEVDESEG